MERGPPFAALLVGEHRALAAAVNNRRVRPRFSRLAERLREKDGGGGLSEIP